MLLRPHSTPFTRSTAAAAFGLCAAAPAFAHAGHEGSLGFLSGLAHPLSGLDHLLAMVGIGIWAVQLGGRATWAIPSAFVALMLAGAGLGLAGVGLPLVEGGIAVSVLVIGLVIATAFRAPLAAGMCLAGTFALFHGHAHGNEIAAGAPALSTMLGFTLATALLQLAGIGIGHLLMLGRSVIPQRIAGGLMAACGCALLANVAIA